MCADFERRWVPRVPWLLTRWSSFCSLCRHCREGLCSSCLHAFVPERTHDFQILDVLLVAPLTYAITADAVIHADFVEHPVTSIPTERCSASHRLSNRGTPVTLPCHRTLISARVSQH